MLRKLIDLMLGMAARAGDLVADDDLRLVMPKNGQCAAQATEKTTKTPNVVAFVAGPCRAGGRH